MPSVEQWWEDFRKRYPGSNGNAVQSVPAVVDNPLQLVLRRYSSVSVNRTMRMPIYGRLITLALSVQAKRLHVRVDSPFPQEPNLRFFPKIQKPTTDSKSNFMFFSKIGIRTKPAEKDSNTAIGRGHAPEHGRVAHALFNRPLFRFGHPFFADISPLCPCNLHLPVPQSLTIAACHRRMLLTWGVV